MLWTDVIDPATLTGYARAALADFELRHGTLARYLPNREVGDVVARFVKGQFGLIPVAKFRAYDAEPEVGQRRPGKRETIELPALGQNIPVSEYEQLRLRGGPIAEDLALVTIQNTTMQVVQAVADAIEQLRGIVLVTGKATIDQDNYQSDDDFARPTEHQLVADDDWADPSVSRLDYLQELIDTFEDTTGEQPGSILMPKRVFRALSNGDEFQVQLINGGARRQNDAEVKAMVVGADLPPIDVYDRRVSVDGTTTRVIRDDTLMLLPAPVAPDDFEGTDLGSTFWGRTLTSTDSDWGIEDSEQPGIVAGVFRNPKPPMGIEVISDAIGLPVLANAEKSLASQVLDTTGS